MPRARQDWKARWSALPPDPSPKAVGTGGNEAIGRAWKEGRRCESSGAPKFYIFIF